MDLQAIQTLGGYIQQPLAAAIVFSHVSHGAPKMLHKGFKILATWVHTFFSDKLGWSMQKSTCATQKILANSNDLCHAMHAQLMLLCNMYNIHPDFIVNADQTGISLFSTGHYMYEVQGLKDVSIMGHNEKWQV